MSFFHLPKPKECESIQSQINRYSPVLSKFIDILFTKNNIDDFDKIQKWIILIIDRLKNKDDRPVINDDKIVINRNLVLEKFLQENKELLEFKQQNDIIRLFKVINLKFNVHWIIWGFSESLSNPVLFMSVFPTLYKSYIKKKESIETNSQSNQQKKNVLCSTSNIFYKKSQFELVIDRYLPLLQITNDFFKEKLIFFSFLFDEIIKITLIEFYELINKHLPLTADFDDKIDNQQNNYSSTKKKFRKIKNSIFIFDHDLEIISKFFKITLCHKITEIHRQLIIFNLFSKRYQKLCRFLKININDIKRNEKNIYYIYFIQRIINCINSFKETILISMMKSFSKSTCPDFHFTMLNFVIQNSSFKNEIFTFQDIKYKSNKQNCEVDTSSECSIETEMPSSKKLEIEISNENELESEDSQIKRSEVESSNIDNLEIENPSIKDQETEKNNISTSESESSNSHISNDQLFQEVSQIIQLNRLKDHFSFTKLCFALSEQEIYDHNDIFALVQVSRMCKRMFSALSVQKLLRIASSDIILSKSALWGFQHSSLNPENFPDRMFGSPGVLTVIVFFIMRAFEFLIVANIPNKYRTKQLLTASTILTLYRRACQSYNDICEEEKTHQIQTQTNTNTNNNVNDFGEDDIGAVNDEINNQNDNVGRGINSNCFQENDDDSNYDGNQSYNKLFVKRGFQMIKKSAEIGIAMMNLFNLSNVALFKDEIKPANLYDLVDQIRDGAKKKQEIDTKIKKISNSKKSQTTNSRRKGTVIIEMINIGFSIVNQTRFYFAMTIYFRKMFGELTRTPLQKFDLKNMCANFEPEFPLLKDSNPPSKNIYIKIQDKLFLKKLNEIAEEAPLNENETKTNDDLVKKEAKNEQKNQPKNPSQIESNENKNNFKNLISASLNLFEKVIPKNNQIVNKKPEIGNKKVTEND